MTAIFHAQLDPSLSGYIYPHDIHHFLLSLSSPKHLNFIQKNLLSLLSKQIFRKLDHQKKGVLSPADLRQHIPKLLILFAGKPPYHTSNLSQRATLHFQSLLSKDDTLSCTELALGLQSQLPKALPQKSFVSLLCARAIFSLLDIPTHTSITKSQWLACAHALLREYNQ